MLSAIQRYTLIKWFNSLLTKNNRDPQAYSVEDFIDSQLSYSENKSALEGLLHLSPDEYLETRAGREYAIAEAARYSAYIEELRNRAFYQLSEDLKATKYGLHNILKVSFWFSYRYYPLAQRWLRLWGVRFEARHATYRYMVSNQVGTVHSKNAQRCPPILVVRMQMEQALRLREKLLDKGIYAQIVHGTTADWINKPVERYRAEVAKIPLPPILLGVHVFP